MNKEKLFLIFTINNAVFFILTFATVYFYPLITQHLGEIGIWSVLFSVFLLFTFTTYMFSKKIDEQNEKDLREINNILLKALEGNLNQSFKKVNNDEFKTLTSNLEKLFKIISTSVHTTDQQYQDLQKQFNNVQNELTVQKEATIKVLSEIEKEKQISESQAQDLKKFQLAVAKASDLIVITNAEGEIIYANNAIQKITGYTQVEVVGTKVGELWGPQKDSELYKELWGVISSKKKFYKNEIVNKKKTGESYISEMSVSPILTKDNEVAFFVSIERDITKAKEIDRMKTEFISLASHQLRSPLTAMRWGLETLATERLGKLNPKQKEYTQDAFEATKRMIELVTGLLNISRIESGRLMINPENTNLFELVTSLVEETNVLALKKQQTISLNCEKDINANFDPVLIRHVYLNLLTNAIKYSPEGTQIKISIKVEEDTIISSVKDQGYGIPLEEQDKIFNKFFRAQNIQGIDTNGSGLGLYLAKSIVNTSQGEIWFESEENKGTTFYFTLPVKGVTSKKGEVSLEA